MPLPTRPPRPNTPAPAVEKNDHVEEPRLADAPTQAPLGFEEEPVFEAPRLARGDEEEQTTPVSSFQLPPAKSLPTAKPASPMEAPSLPTIPAAPIQAPVAPVAAAEPVSQPEPTPVPNAAPTHYRAAEDEEDNRTLEEKTAEFIKSLSREVKESVRILFEHITDEESSEVLLNGPQLVGFKQGGQRFFDERIDFVDVETYHAVLNHFLLPLTTTSERIGVQKNLIEGQLRIEDEKDPSRPPLVARVHVIDNNGFAKVTIAKKSRTRMTIDNMITNGTMSADMGMLLKAFARGRVTMIFSGMTGAGKSTALEAVSRDFDVNDRIVLIEDTPELALPVSDVVELLSTQDRPGDDPRDLVTLDWLVRQANRMRPDRIIVGEIRGGEMSDFLIAANSGADGSMTTVHADSPQGTLRKIVSLAMLSDHGSKSETSIYRNIASSVQIIVQMTLIDNKHVVTHIEEVSNTVLQNGNGIATNPLYRYDRNTQQFQAEGRVSDELKAYLNQRGVTLPNATPTNFRAF